MSTGMRKDTKVVAQEGMSTNTSIFFKCGYGDGHCSTLPIGYPLSSLKEFHMKVHIINVLFKWLISIDNKPFKII